MRNQTYTSRRGTNYQPQNSWVKNRNTVRRTQEGIGKYSFSIIAVLLVLIVGLIYVAQGTKATSYDYQISEIEDQIAELEAKKEDLAVEQARLTSVATANTSDVALAMEDAEVSGYAE